MTLEGATDTAVFQAGRPTPQDLNPIETMGSKVKALVRAVEARTSEDLQRAISQALHKVSAENTCGWFGACGYSII